LFVRERPGSATMTMAADSGRYDPTMNAIYGNPAIIHRIGGARLTDLRRRAEAENAWVIGRELIRHMRPQEGRNWLTRSLRAAPGIKRLGLWGLSLLQVGPFRPYVMSKR
jgi:hypothetical protein